MPLDSSSGYTLVLQLIMCHHRGFESGFLSEQPAAARSAGKASSALHPRGLGSAVPALGQLLRCVCVCQAPRCSQSPKGFFLQPFPIWSQLLPHKSKNRNSLLL